jgi:hypothetical protein
MARAGSALGRLSSEAANMPICGVAFLGIVRPVRPSWRALPQIIFRVNAIHERLIQRFLKSF